MKKVILSIFFITNIFACTSTQCINGLDFKLIQYTTDGTNKKDISKIKNEFIQKAKKNICSDQQLKKDILDGKSITISLIIEKGRFDGVELKYNFDRSDCLE